MFQTDDLTGWEHDGGNIFTDPLCGTDATAIFDISHPMGYLAEMHEEMIGIITGSNPGPHPMEEESTDEEEEEEEEEEESVEEEDSEDRKKK